MLMAPRAGLAGIVGVAAAGIIAMKFGQGMAGLTRAVVDSVAVLVIIRERME